MPKQLEFKKVKGWGGKRRGAGRKRRKGPAHARRQRVDFNKPLHITMRVREGIPSLRNKQVLKNFKRAVQQASSFGLHVIQYSLLSNHIHMIAEAKDNDALARGMKSLAGKFAKALDAGKVFAGRFHVHVLKTPTEMRRALEYVLLNFAKHGSRIEHIDEFSSGFSFRGWKQLLKGRYRALIEEQLENMKARLAEELSAPRSWLCRAGWMRS